MEPGENGTVKVSLSLDYFFLRKELWGRCQKTRVEILSWQLTHGEDAASLNLSVLIYETRVDLTFCPSFIHVETLTLAPT